jgi:DNA-binding IclR family transcriptional regulator
MNKKPQTGKKKESRYNIRVLDRAFRVFSLLADGKARTLNEISEAISLSPSTTFRLLTTMASHNYVKRDDIKNQYQLGLSCLYLARAYQDSNDIRKTALPELEALRDETKETVHLAIFDTMEVVYLEKLPGLHAMGIMSSRVGGRSPAHCTGLGKVFLAYLPPDEVSSYFAEKGLHRYTETTITDLTELVKHLTTIRNQGYAFDKGEHEFEVRCVAVPIFDISEQVVSALSISGSSIRLDPLEENQDIIRKACKTASNISRQLGYTGKNKPSTKQG